MCQQIVQFCTGSTKPLLFIGGFLSLVLAAAIGYTACTSQALYTEIDASQADKQALVYHLQLAGAVYLFLIAILSCYAAQYDQKHSIRALSIITTLNFLLALAAMWMAASRDMGALFKPTLEQAMKNYNISMLNTVAENVPNNNNSQLARVLTSSPSTDEPAPKNATTGNRIWDRLQARGCCGIVNGTQEWIAEYKKLPKSCCTKLEGDNECHKVDAGHSQGCLALISSTDLNLLIVLALIAVVNFYLAVTTGINAYRTFHYDEASQSAYS